MGASSRAPKWRARDPPPPPRDPPCPPRDPPSPATRPGVPSTRCAVSFTRCAISSTRSAPSSTRCAISSRRCATSSKRRAMPSHETAGLLHEVRHLFDDTRRLDEEIADLVHGSPPFALVVPLQLPPHAREVRGRVRPQLRKQDHDPPDTLSPRANPSLAWDPVRVEPSSHRPAADPEGSGELADRVERLQRSRRHGPPRVIPQARPPRPPRTRSPLRSGAARPHGEPRRSPRCPRRLPRALRFAGRAP